MLLLGTAVITDRDALMWTDGRYFLQAEEEMDENWTLMRDGLRETPSRGEWLAANLESGQAVGVDPFLVPAAEWDRLSAPLTEAALVLRPVAENLVDKVWGAEQPGYPENPVVPLEKEFTGEALFARADSTVILDETFLSAQPILVSPLEPHQW